MATVAHPPLSADGLRCDVAGEVPTRLACALADRVVALQRRGGSPHALLAVAGTAPGGRRWHWIGAGGPADATGAPMGPDTPFNVASIDKMHTATLVLQLAEERELALDDPVVAHLPQAAGLHRLDGVDHTPRLTIRHLLAHASGLPDWLEDRPKRPRGARSVVETVLAEGDRDWPLEAVLAHVRERLQPHFAPVLRGAAERVRYSDTNYLLLAAIVERIAGEPLHAVHSRRLAQPLGLRRTWIEGGRPLDAAAAPAALWAGTRPLALPRLMRSLRALHAAAGDLLRFGRALLAGWPFADAATARAMQRGWHRFGLPLDRAAMRQPGWPIEYGLGLMRWRDPLAVLAARLRPPPRPVPSFVGHSGSTGCWLFREPARDLWLAGTVDEVGAGALPYRTLPALVALVDRFGPPPDR